MAGSVDALRRWFGVFFLIVAAGFLVWGQTVLKSFLESHPVFFLGYWFLCFAFTILAIIMALLDMRATRRRTMQEQKDLLEHTLREIQSEEESNHARK